MKPLIIFPLLFFFLIFNAPASADHLIISGTGDSQVILRELARIFENSHPGSQVSIPDSVGSGGGIKQLVKGKIGLARTARPLKEKEKKYGFVQIPFALSPIVFAAHPDPVSAVTDISLPQIIEMYSGKIKNWSNLGGPDHKLYLVDREAGDSSKKAIDKYLISSHGLTRGLGFGGITYYSTPETANAVAQNKYTIAYLPFSTARNARLHLFSIDGVFPDANSIKNKKYPFITTFYIVSPAAPDPLARSFIQFLALDTAKQAMRASGVFPLE